MSIPLDQAIQTMVNIFNQYLDRVGNTSIMRKRNLKELIQNEMNVGPILEQPEYQTLMADLDRHGDQRVDFLEFVSILCTVASIKNDQ